MNWHDCGLLGINRRWASRIFRRGFVSVYGGVVAVGLPASDVFWAGPSKPWTAVKIRGGENMMVDHASSA